MRLTFLPSDGREVGTVLAGSFDGGDPFVDEWDNREGSKFELFFILESNRLLYGRARQAIAMGKLTI